MAVAQPSGTLSSKPVWLFNPTFDLLGLGGGTFLVLLILLMLGTLMVSPSQYGWIYAVSFTSGIFVNFPHYAATYYKVYRQKSQILKYSREAIWAPVLLLLLAVPCFLQPTLAPWYAFLFFTVSGYHYAGQTYGISMIFIGKSGHRFTPLQKQLFMFPIYATFVFTFIYQNTLGVTPIPFYGAQIPVLGFPHWLMQLSFSAVGLSVLLYLGLNFHLYKTERREIPPIVQVIIGAHLLWFTLGNLSQMFYLFIPFLHCLQYLMVTVYCDYKERSSQPGSLLRSYGDYFKSKDFFKYYGWQLVVGASLFIGIPLLFQGVGIAPFGFASLVIVAFLNLHHFILDGAIWKLRKPEVSKPLMT